MLDKFRTTATELHLPLFEVYAQFIEASHELSAGGTPRPGGSPTGPRRRHPLARRNAEVDPRRHPVPAVARHRAAGRPAPRDRAAGRRQPAPAAVADRPRPGARRGRPGARRQRLLAELVDVDGLHLRDNQMFFPSALRTRRRRLHARRPARSEILFRALEPYATGSRSPAWRASRWARSAGTPGVPPTPPATSTRPRSCCARRSPCARTSASGRTRRSPERTSPRCSAGSTGLATAPRRMPSRRRHGRSPTRIGLRSSGRIEPIGGSRT